MPLALSLSIALVGCATTSSRTADRVAGTPIRGVASTEGLFWLAHPCKEVKGAPFRKYHSFALDESAGVIYARTSEAAQPVDLKDKPRGKVAWDSVTEFLGAKGITDFCAQAGNSAGPAPAKPPGEAPPANPKPQKPPRGNGEDGASRGDYRPGPSTYVAPVNADPALYYKSVQNVSTDVKKEYYRFLASPHVQAVGEADEVVSTCPSDLSQGKVCVHQLVQDYKQARSMMMGEVDLRKTADGEYEVFDYYCQKWLGKADFANLTSREEDLPGPGHIVHSQKANAEHTWPQSKFPDPKGSALNLMEKTDLHHIYPTDTKVNGIRGNFDFAEVDPSSSRAMTCSDGRFGTAKPVEGLTVDGTSAFEPPTAHKGNVARSLMYFSVRYNGGMSSLQEYYIRKWNREDPPDDAEKARNEKLYKLIGVRNPFVDDSSLADRIPRFCRLRVTADQAEGKNDCP